MNLNEILKDVEKPLIIGHQNADPDAVCAMIAFARLYGLINPSGFATLVADDSSKLSNQVLRKFAPDVSIKKTSDESHDFYVLIDTNSRFQLGPALQDIIIDSTITLVVDHHEANLEIDSLAKYQIVHSEKSSTCEILVDVFEELGISIDSDTANLLLTGMLFDTRRFFYADTNTLSAAIKLVRAGAVYDECVKSLLIQPDRSERIARLKAARRVKVHLVGNWILAVSKINAFEASACRGLIELGADVAIVGGSPRKGTVRLSSRSTRAFYESTGINLGTDVMDTIGVLIDGEGGGHANAAGANGKKHLDEALEKSLEIIRSAIEDTSIESDE
ncbi:MAG: bifunctional oligoribonuclease/PAP phosphatase NrnA [Candidatus Thorarchaeota archaeon]